MKIFSDDDRFIIAALLFIIVRCIVLRSDILLFLVFALPLFNRVRSDAFSGTKNETSGGMRKDFSEFLRGCGYMFHNLFQRDFRITLKNAFTLFNQ